MHVETKHPVAMGAILVRCSFSTAFPAKDSLTPWIGQSQGSAIDISLPTQRLGFRCLFTHTSQGLPLFKVPRNRHGLVCGYNLEQTRSHWGHHIDRWMLC